MSYSNKDFEDFDGSESLDIATDLQKIHSAAALSKTYEDQQKSMLSRMKHSIRTKKGEQMVDFDADASGYTEPDTSWQRLNQVHHSSRT